MEKNLPFKDQQIAGDVLSSQKSTTELYNKFALESNMPKLREDFMKILNQEHEMQIEMFELMKNKGWYPLEFAESKKIQEAKKIFEL